MKEWGMVALAVLIACIVLAVLVFAATLRTRGVYGVPHNPQTTNSVARASSTTSPAETVVESDASGSHPIYTDFSQLLADLKKQNLPVPFPDVSPLGSADVQYFAYDVTPTGYYIQIASSPNCFSWIDDSLSAVANSCDEGQMGVHTAPDQFFNPFSNASDLPYSVELEGGVIGHYAKRACGGSCTQPSIEWIHGGRGYYLDNIAVQENYQSLIDYARKSVDVQGSGLSETPYTNAAYQYRIQFPAGWFLQPDPYDEASYAATADGKSPWAYAPGNWSASSPGLEVMRVYVSEFSKLQQQYSCQALLDCIRDEFGASGTVVQTTINGLDAVTVGHDQDAGYELSLFAVKNGYLYEADAIFSTTTGYADFRKYEEIIRASLSSLTVS
jgi:hypothetical protein